MKPIQPRASWEKALPYVLFVVEEITAPPEKFVCRSVRHPTNTKIRLNSTTHIMPPQRRALEEISRNKRAKPNLTPEERARIIGKAEAGCSTKELGEEFGVTPQCIRNTLRRWASYATIKDLPRSGRPKKTTPRDVRRLVIQA